ncbi:hypothetical protein T12_14875 [Trichinella patagoniensis]|uniref:Uncharacterized protein n=1 Tax=Trichinella patagoniensis TaxID=990121 RepID=A0A0V0ZH74_9BILA|nr:hypothetical protein T12_14875 [Trichinella patagoniensis]
MGLQKQRKAAPHFSSAQLINQRTFCALFKSKSPMTKTMDARTVTVHPHNTVMKRNNPAHRECDRRCCACVQCIIVVFHLSVRVNCELISACPSFSMPTRCHPVPEIAES